MGVTGEERERWVRAAYLHDALRDAPLDQLRRLSAKQWRNAELLHGPAAAALAAEHGEADHGVLDAVRYHSVGFAGWDAAGRMLYLADYLEPGRDFRAAERRALAARVPGEPEEVLRIVAAERLSWIISSRWPIPPETTDFWNSLAASA
jgi:HD superfamily phosphohydrolase YqeK